MNDTCCFRRAGGRMKEPMRMMRLMYLFMLAWSCVLALAAPSYGAGQQSPAEDDAKLWSLIEGNLTEANAAYGAGHAAEAYRLAVSAYLDGFELVETRLDLVDHGLMKSIESAMADLRHSIRAGVPPEEVGRQYTDLQKLLERARDALHQDAGIAPLLAATSSGAILLREGTEAVLVIAALIAFLRKTGRERAIAHIHAGWIAALLLGVAMWWLASAAIEISGAGREATEGVVALLAAAMLIYVGYWLHDNMHARRWKIYLHDRVDGAFGDGRLWVLTLISFAAAFREVFETVLFYQALALEAGPGSGPYLLAGGIAGMLLLVVVAFVIFHLSVRLPMRLFFGVNALILVVLSLVIAGKGIAALQEAGYIPTDRVSFPEWSAVGLYANWESLGVQAVMLTLIAGLLVMSHLRSQGPYLSRR